MIPLINGGVGNAWVEKSRLILALLSGIWTIGLWAPTAQAQLIGDDAVQAARSSSPDRPAPLFQAVLRFGQLGEDTVANANFRLNYNTPLWGFGIQAPIRMRLVDKEPKNDDLLGFLRREDWDQPSDALRILRYAYAGDPSKTGPYFVCAGELLKLTIGNGTILHRYHNGMDLSRWRAGLEARANVGGFSAEAMVGDIMLPYLVGLRLAARPFEMAGITRGPLSRIEIGTSFVTDWMAPRTLVTEPLDPANPEGARQVISDDKDVPLVSRDQFMAVVGTDLSYTQPILKHFTQKLDLKLYTDFNKVLPLKQAFGVHVGALGRLYLRLSRNQAVNFALRAEYRLGTENYIAPYFNTVYEIERYQRLQTSGGSGESKLAYLCVTETCDEGALGLRHGMFIELQWNWPDIIRLGGAYLSYTGGREDGSFRLALEVPALEYLEFKAFYYRINVASVKDLFGFDDKSAIVMELKFPIIWFLTFNFKWWKVWESQAQGGFQSVDDWSAGVGIRIRL